MYVLISVVIPTYRRPQLLARCLSALAAQTLNNAWFEIVIVCDGPDPATTSILSAFRKTAGMQAEYIVLPRNSGPAAARNAGWMHAHGKYIAFTDDDCIPDPQWLEAILNAFESGKGQAFHGRVKVPMPERPTDHEWNTHLLEEAQFITANAACTRAALLETGGFDERFRMAWREDSDLEFALRDTGITPRFLPDALVVHPVRTPGWGISMKEQKKALYNALLYKKYPLYYKKYIRQFIPPLYYITVTAALGSFLCFLLKMHTWAYTFLLIWVICLVAFTFKRLRHTKRSADHVLEMICTSVCIPFSSIYWNLQGRWKFKDVYTLQKSA
ncbi:glycosyltransferase family 2 protein [Niabella sp. CC-SYL272]|uniref:glycosyltransferase family 2 protein n=1 Tax=Niabella agricola TaxID=2891571 RepID=UPI001F2359EB|nr:glycosyltransferase [Niabella agricola]MCF3108328.1 glycosyltransferase family 2 protein [Niabella agricola]